MFSESDGLHTLMLPILLFLDMLKLKTGNGNVQGLQLTCNS